MSLSKPLKDSSASVANNSVGAELPPGRGRRDDTKRSSSSMTAKATTTATAGTAKAGARAASTNRSNAGLDVGSPNGDDATTEAASVAAVESPAPRRRRGGDTPSRSRRRRSKSSPASNATDAAFWGGTARNNRGKQRRHIGPPGEGRPPVKDGALSKKKKDDEAAEEEEALMEAEAAEVVMVQMNFVERQQKQIKDLREEVRRLKQDAEVRRQEDAQAHVVHRQHEIKNENLRVALWKAMKGVELAAVARFFTDKENAAKEEMLIDILPRFALPELQEQVPASEQENMACFVCYCEHCEDVDSAFKVYFPPERGHRPVPLPDKSRHSVIRHLRDVKADLSNLPPDLPLLEPWTISKELQSCMDRGLEGVGICEGCACATRGRAPCSPERQAQRTYFVCQCEVCNNDDLENAYIVSWLTESTPGFAPGFADYDVPLPRAIQLHAEYHLQQVGADLSKVPGALE